MAYTLAKDGVSMDLPPDLLWSDEFAWSSVSQGTERSITGALLVDVSERANAGMPITLTGTDRHALMRRSEVKALRAWIALPDQKFALTINGEAFTVIFDHGTEEESRAFTCTPFVEYSDPQDDDYYCGVTLRFITTTP